MVVVVFRSRLKPGIEKEVEETDARMAELAARMPGYEARVTEGCHAHGARAFTLTGFAARAGAAPRRRAE